MDRRTFLTTNAAAASLSCLSGRDLLEVETLAAGLDPLPRWRGDPSLLLTDAGLKPDPWQARCLRSDAPRQLLLCSRQSGKTTAAAGLALKAALLDAPALVLILSPTLRQSGEFFRDKFLRLWDALGRPAAGRAPTQLTLEMGNGSRVVSLPENEAGIRGYSGVRLLVIDEASRVDDSLYYAVRPMLSVSGGRLAALSTPFGQRGWFHGEWERGAGWERYRVTAAECPRIDPAFLAEERAALGPRWYAQEYEVSFEAAIGAVFAPEAVDAAVSDEVRPIRLPGV
jgi:hypothetical protein